MRRTINARGSAPALVLGAAVALAIVVGAVVRAHQSDSEPIRASASTPPLAGQATISGPIASVPGATWEKVEPAAVGLDAAKLEQIAAQAKAGKSNCLVVVRDGKLAGEWYFRGTDENTTQDVF